MNPTIESQIRFLFGNQPGYTVQPDAEPGILNVRDEETGRIWEVAITEHTH